MTALTTFRPRTGMDLLRRDPFFNRLFGDWMDDIEPDTRNWMPSVDVVERAEHYEVRVDVPGIDPKDIEVTLQNDVLTVRGERHGESTEKDSEGKVLRQESWTGRFERSVRLPGNVESGKVKAKGKDGVLTISLPKAKESIGRRIAIES